MLFLKIDVLTTFNNCFNRVSKITMDAMLCAEFCSKFENTLCRVVFSGTFGNVL